ncbi:GNAT family N-acetyltransferase [Pseudomonas savastanoi pv. phaseolicola]|uniref:Acetyltransferase, GNAT family n=5 Tax=Pseudomonas syringae group TaxID=136849 RepID=A0A3M3FYT8_PSESG|nr:MULTISPECIES: GNAT family N-acetyltransferase [Pseudomonas]KPB88106.1 Acetyltransferase [Pseudomonas syringae pv. maculicola]AAZ37876.1 acetyltransferase, GNAT family [Pseudomonas savastanoi pv. phaseolicola 1448A]EKG29704.1 acetyltransferase [Pseudomonas avellanae BPIC 631]KPB36989.1 Acetyltransferase [Pseudomonas savastanoi pv. phaseolicola]KPB38382.1 Acetyltransferase [Pseudomonas savastanoi pv. phaseolicola]
MNVIACELQHLDAAAYLFNQYRMFYQEADDLPTARDFLKSNLDNQTSRIYLLLDDQNEPVGFAQLYPATCSLAMKRFYWIYDLFVEPRVRRQGNARYLMNQLTDIFTREGAQRLSLDTAKANVTAQALYESLGYEAEQTFITYHKILNH